MAKYGTKSNPVEAADMSDAFDVCREMGRPIAVRIRDTGEFGRVYPSGRWGAYRDGNMEYTIKYASGITFEHNGSLMSAKREATKRLAYGAGDVTILVDGEPVCRRRFTEIGRRFWWGTWEPVEL